MEKISAYMKPYYGGNGITFDKLKATKPTINVDGTHYRRMVKGMRSV